MKRKLVMMVLLALSVSLIFSWQAMAVEMTIVGRVTDSSVIVTEDGEEYSVDLNDLGDELLFDHDGKMVEVKGIVEEADDVKIITVLAYSVIEE
jgi:regulatory protein YycH of two-component signal transduction system YycFG